MTRVFLLVAAVFIGALAEHDGGIKQQLTDTYHQTSSKVNETMGTIKEKSEQLGKNLSESGQSIFTQISDFFQSLASSIASLFRSIFGGETPGQPAMADDAALAEPEQPLHPVGVKLMYLSALGLLAWWVAAYCKPVKQTDYDYRNMEENLL